MTENALPASIDDLLELMEECAHFHWPTWVFWPEGSYGPERTEFRRRFFAAHTSYYLVEMIPFVKYDHRFWPGVVTAVHEALLVREVIHQNHRCAELLKKAPEVWLPDEYLVRR